MQDIVKPNKKTNAKDLQEFARLMFLDEVSKGKDVAGICNQIAIFLQKECGLKTNQSTVHRWRKKNNWDLEAKLMIEDKIEGKISDDLTRMYQTAVNLFFSSANALEEMKDIIEPKDHIAILRTTADTIAKVAGIQERQTVEVSGSVQTNSKIVVEKIYSSVEDAEKAKEESENE